jgi:hypothetical protein
VTYEGRSGIVADLTERSIGSLIRDGILSGVKSVSSGLSASVAMREALTRGFMATLRGGVAVELCAQRL